MISKIVAGQKLTPDDVRGVLLSPTVEHIFPYRFANGTVVSEFHSNCGRCGGRISEINTHGGIVFENEHSVAMELIAACHREGCCLFHLYSVRFSDDGSYLSKIANGCWTRQWLETKENRGFVSKVNAFLASIKRGIGGVQ